MNSRLNQFASLGACALLAGCHSAPAQPSRAAAPVGVAPVAAASTPSAEPVAIPTRAAQQYEQALQMMKSGRKTDAELEFKQLI
ncbi:MAG TPA: hypothetical protein VGD54_10020, partial [Steroidobacteraceae bacterium]